MADLTPEQRKAAASEDAWDLINAISDPVLDAIHHGESGLRCADSIKSALIALGWRAPGPATEAEVERAARANIDPRTDPSNVELRRARAALNAALNQEAGNG